MAPMHTIRLRGPWECLIDGDAVQTVDFDSIEWTKLAVPSSSLVLRRRFNRPTGISDESVSLAVRDFPAAVAVSLNDQSLGQGESSMRVSIKELLQDHNVLQIEFHDPGSLAAGQRIGSVCIEIEIQK